MLAGPCAMPAVQTAVHAASGSGSGASSDGCPPSNSDDTDGSNYGPQAHMPPRRSGDGRAASRLGAHVNTSPPLSFCSCAPPGSACSYPPSLISDGASSAPSSCASSECGDGPASRSSSFASAPAAGPAAPAPARAAAAPAPPPVVHFNWADRAARPLAEAALATLVTAMAADPVNTFLLGGARHQARFARKEIKGYVKALPAAAHFIATPDAAAAALWQLLPEETPCNELLAGMSRILRVPLRLWPALVALELRYEAAHAREAATELGRRGYYYLSFIGTAPAARGRGYASALIAPVTARADAEARLCLLEATSERSAALYARHGFEVYETYRAAPGAPPVFFMRRLPRGGVAAAAAAAAPAPPAPPAAAAPVAAFAPAPPPAAPVTGAAAGPARALVRALSAKADAAAAAAGPARRRVAPVDSSDDSSGSDTDSDDSFIAAAVIFHTLSSDEDGASEDEEDERAASRRLRKVHARCA